MPQGLSQINEMLDRRRKTLHAAVLGARHKKNKHVHI